MRLAGLVLAASAALACVSPPRPSPAELALEKNPKAVVEGRVVDLHGNPVAGLRVDAIPRSEIPWSEPAQTGPDGSFRLELFAPGNYSFALRRGERTVVTDDPRDPSRVRVTVTPGGRTEGVELLFLEEEWHDNRGTIYNLYGPGDHALRLRLTARSASSSSLAAPARSARCS